MSYSYKVPPPWQTGYVLPGYIAEHSPVFYPAGVSRYAGAALGGLGAVARLDKALLTLPSGQKAIDNTPVFTKPRIIVGPFNFDAKDGGTQKYPRNWLLGPRGKITMDFISMGISKLMTSQAGWLCFQQPGAVCYPKWPLDSKTWDVQFPLGERTVGLPVQLWKGTTPIIKTKHPTTGEMWGLYVEFVTGAAVVTFKPIRELVITKLLSVIVEVISFIIDTIGDLLELLGKIACAAMKPAVTALMAYATGGVSAVGGPPAPTEGMSYEEYEMQRRGWEQLKAANVQNSKIQSLRTSASNAVATEVANKLSQTFCGGGDVWAPGGAGVPGWVWPAAVVGGAALAAKLLKGR